MNQDSTSDELSSLVSGYDLIVIDEAQRVVNTIDSEILNSQTF